MVLAKQWQSRQTVAIATDHEVMSAGDGTEAMELLHKHDFELDVTPDSSKLQAGFQPVR